MTKYPPNSEGYQSGSSYGQPQQPQYGQSSAPYGDYSSGEYQPSYSQPSAYEGSNQGSAQGYYGSNDQPYQQYPHDRPPPPDQYYQGPPESSYPLQQQQYSQHQYGGAPPPGYDQRQQYSPQPGYAQPQYNQGSSAPPQQWNQQHGPPTMPPQGQYESPLSQYTSAAGQTEEDRGLMGALAGGAAGAYGGHKMHHGFLGGIGGAVAGSMLEDAYKKKHKKEKKPKKSRRGSHSSSSSSSSSDSDSDSSSNKRKKHGGGSVMAGNFHASSRSVRLEGRSLLVADCADKQGHLRPSALDLNDCFTNTNGRLGWARGGNFAASARNVRLADNGKILECELGNGRGGWESNWVRLDERITNENGELRMI